LGITKIVLVAVVVGILASFGIASTVQFAEGAVGWKGFLKEIGFNAPSVYEVSDTTLIEAGETSNEVISLVCLDGDWMDNTDNINFVTNVDVDEPGLSRLHDTDAMFILDPASLATTGPTLSKRIGYSVLPELQGSATPFDFDVLVTVTILCNSPSSFQTTLGGTWQPVDTTALLIGYSVLNAYWIAPTAIGFGVGIYLIKKRF